MRWTVAWSEVASQNVLLKVVIAVLAVTTLISSIALVQVSERDPIVIERGDFTKALTKSTNDRTESETKTFVEEVLKQRFNTGIMALPGYMKDSEENFKKQESDNLKSSNISQKIVVNNVKIEKDRIIVDSDRLISVGPVRSAFSFPLIVNVAPVPRTLGNPYGLQLVRVTKKDPKEKDK